MTYLLAKYALVFLLALISGILFGRWMTQRRFVDVSESYEDLRDAATRSDTAQWSKLWDRLDALPEPKEVDYSTLTDRLDGLAYAIGNLPEPSPVDLAPLQSSMASLRKDIQEIPAVETHAAVDISPVREQVGSLERQIRAIPQQPAVDLSPIDQRLGAIESELGRLGRRLEIVPQENSAPVEAAISGPATLKSASYGDKDSLRLIFGVGPMLEDLLNIHGIFYFWQIAGWTDRDIEIMDARLDTFKGRIVRDNWVDHAKQLSREPASAQKPEEVRISA